LVQVLQELVRRELDLLVPPLGGPVVARDDPRPVQPAVVAVHERVARLRAVVRALGQAEVPARVLLPRVALEVRVLGVGARLHLAPLAVEHVLPRVDQVAGELDRGRVHGVAGHAPIYPVPHSPLARPGAGPKNRAVTRADSTSTAPALLER